MKKKDCSVHLKKGAACSCDARYLVDGEFRCTRHTPRELRDDAHEAFFTMPQLRDRGWSETTVRKVLGEPDAESDNPTYASGKPMRLWLRSRVVAAENCPGVNWKKNERRSEAASHAAERRSEALNNEIAQIQIDFSAVPDALEELAKVAIQHRNDYRSSYRDRYGNPLDERRGFEEAYWTPGCENEPHVQRWIVNYLRHAATVYDETRVIHRGKPGIFQATETFRSHVLKAIAERWPVLKSECERQDSDLLRNGRGT